MMKLQEEHINKLCEAIQLEQEAKNDPADQPYRSQYKARALYLDVLTHIDERIENRGVDASGDDTGLMLVAMQCFLITRLGINYYDTEERLEAQNRLENSCKIVESQNDRRLFGAVLQLTLNQLGVLWSALNELERAEGYLRRALQFYEDYSRKELVEQSGATPVCFEEMFGLLESSSGAQMSKETASENEFQTNYTMTIYYLAQVLQSAGRTDEAAQFCHATLRRQLQRLQYEPVDWSLNAATLSQVYVTRGQWAVARHCLSAASSLIENITSSEQESKKDEVLRARASVQRCWVKYSLNLLEKSFERIAENNEAAHEVPEDQEITPELLFDMELSRWEDAVPYKFVRNFEEARPVFLFAQSKISEAKEYFTLNDCCSDYVELVQDHSSAFRLLALFELDLERQCRMHKRRIDMLKEVLAALNVQHYLLVCRQLVFELGEVFSGMLDLKLALLEIGGSPANTHAGRKINSLALDAIAQFERFLELFRRPDGSLPEVYPLEDTRSVLLAHFYCGRLHSKILEPDRRLRVQLIQRSIDCYRTVVDYCENNPEAAECVHTELELCAEMVILLPVKMQTIADGGKC